MERIIKKLYHNPIISRIFHTLVYCLKRELEDCESVLDLGCGSSSPIQYCKNIKYSVGVDAYKPYLEESKKKKIHDKYILGDITKVNFKPKSFDAVIMIDVLEHLEKESGNQLLEKAENWARKKIIVSTPNGFLPGEDRISFQSHRFGWTIREMKKLGYRIYGMAGLKFLRKRKVDENINNEDLFTIRFRPKFFWFLIGVFTQLITYYFPNLAFEVFCVKILNS